MNQVDRLLVEHVAGGVVDSRRVLALVAADGRVDEQLQPQWDAGVAGVERGHGGEVAAGGVAADGQVVEVDAELGGVGDDDVERGDGVLAAPPGTGARAPAGSRRR